MKSILIIFLTALTLSAQSANDILSKVRLVSTLTKSDLTGKLKKGSANIPVKLYMRGKDIQMQYKGQKNEWKGIHLQLNDESCELYDVKASEMTPFQDRKIGQNIADTDLTYEDLSMRFLYWPDPEIVGEDTIQTQGCFIVRVHNPDKRGNYAVCDLYVHKKASALMQVKAYDWKAKLIKKFKVSDLMQVDGDYVMEKMKVETIEDDRTQSISYLIFDNPDRDTNMTRSRKLR